jgi:two-component system, cell cycle sensor histidine kinase and response regulator CckA
MRDQDKTKEQLIDELREMRERVSELEIAQTLVLGIERALRESEDRYRTFFVTSRDCVFITSTDGRFIDFNDAALELLGYEPNERQEVLMKNVALSYAHPEERDAHALMVAEIGFSKKYPVDLRKKDGTIIHTLITTVARKDPQGNIIGFQGTIMDFTERRQAQEAP